MDPASLAAAFESSALALWMRGGWPYAIVNVIHLAGLMLLLGPILLLDLRLLGLGKRFPAVQVSQALTPFAVAGLTIAVLSGIALFSADASALIGNRMMQLKLCAIALSLANVLTFRAVFARHLPAWDQRRPVAGRASAAASIGLWLTVLVAGRLIAYV
jgi:hypothetical protein